MAQKRIAPYPRHHWNKHSNIRSRTVVAIDTTMVRPFSLRNAFKCVPPLCSGVYSNLRFKRNCWVKK